MGYTTYFGKLVPTHLTRNIRVEPYKSETLRNREQNTKLVDKGRYKGACNRSACLAPNPTWYNHSTQKYYCADCAWDLNHDAFNKKYALELYGHYLCTEGEYK